VIFLKVIAKPIQMIAWFNEDGTINPIKFKIDEEENKVIKIERILKREQEKLAGNTMEKFTCSSCINGIEKIFEIKYDIKNYKWILFKI
jgi:hypothetical protein